MLLVYSAAIFLSAALLFMVQPMAAKQVLPLLGGTPAVWTTSMLFFQAALLAGYTYAHLLSRLAVKVQPIVHLVILAGAVVLALPIGIHGTPPAPPQAIGSGAELELAFYLLRMLCVSVGLPFFLLSTTGPLLQRWFSRTGHAQAADPYFLYAASNAGSFLGLLSYPFLVEPAAGLDVQEKYWSWGFVGFCVLALACAGVLWARGKTGAAESAHSTTGADEAVTGSRRLKWVILAAVPSSLLLGATQTVSTDVAAMPLLWVIPLALYLLTFVLVFAKKQFLSARVLGYVTALGVVAVCIVTGLYVRENIVLLISVHVLTFFFAAWMCHKRLADDRPGAAHLTEYFLWMSVGGMIGGLFNALLAPAIFNDILEYPIALIAACLLRPGRASATNTINADKGARFGATGIISVAMVTAVAVSIGVGLMLEMKAGSTGNEHSSSGMYLRVLIPAAILVGGIARVPAFAIAAAAALGVARMVPDYSSERLLFQERSFYGVHRVKESLDHRQRILLHGTTAHGLQNRDLPGENSKWERTPTAYYHPAGPLGQMFIGLKSQGDRRISRVGAIGLGVGSVAAYAVQGARFTFYEIDDVVIRVAKDPTLFTFLANAGDRVETVLGDGRLGVARAVDGEFDVLVVDAFSSDSIPAHLMTVEAFKLYVQKLAPDGVLAVHVTNLHLELRPVVARIAKELGLTAIVQVDRSVDENTKKQGRLPGTTWVLLARQPRQLAPMIDDLSNWPRLESNVTDPLWTDSYSSLVGVMRR